MIVRLSATILMGFVAIMPTTGTAALQFDVLRYNALVKFVVSGEFEAGDADRFVEFWNEHAFDAHRFAVAFDSPGGNLMAGVKLGTFLRERGVETVIQRFRKRNPSESDWDYSYANELPGARCFSACAIAFMGGLERSIPEDATVGFHQFSGIHSDDPSEDKVTTQALSAILSQYLREVGAAPQLFEIMSMTRPEEMFVPTSAQVVALGIVPSPAFRNFSLFPRDGHTLAAAENEANFRGLERVTRIETMCWRGVPLINLFTKSPQSGLSPYYAAPETTHIDGFRVNTDFGNFEFGSDSLRLYAQSEILASLILNPEVARAFSSGSSTIWVNSYTASGVLMSASVAASPGGDEAIQASFRDCL